MAGLAVQQQRGITVTYKGILVGNIWLISGSKTRF
jgi:hypothetical protein